MSLRVSSLVPPSDVHIEGSEAGAAIRVLRPRRAAPADALRPTRAEVNLAHLRHNLRVLTRGVTPAAGGRAPEVWGVLKADAYGHGAPAVARTLERAGITGLCVAILEEAVELRAAGIRTPILVMGGLHGLRRDGIEELLHNELVPVVYDAGQIERIATFARFEAEGPIRVHLKVDTGMGRLGVSKDDLDNVLEVLSRSPEVKLEGLMTHFACADAPDLETTRAQLRAFAEIERKAARLGLVPRLRHAANSAATMRLPEARLDVVRPGIAVFGVSPFASELDADASDPATTLARELKPVMRVRTEIVSLRNVAPGDCIGYGHTWKAERPSVIATVPMGYADGLSRSLSNRGHALVRGKRAPIAGTVSMDLTMIDVTDLPGVRLGDEAVLLGQQEGPLGKDTIGAAEVAAHTGTIPWEVLTSISRRVPRFYREP
ncbi:Alanine racemase [Minicystis rosea]|nr:Alanine racemase [Minicystis rosea]